MTERHGLHPSHCPRMGRRRECREGGCCWFERFSSQNVNSLELSDNREEELGQAMGERVKWVPAVNKVKHMIDGGRKMEFSETGPATAPSNCASACHFF